MRRPSWLSPLLIGLAIVFQIGVVAAMAISREWILASGTPIVLQTAPVDPRDIFRGDYVRLDYLFSRIPVSMMDDAIVDEGLRKGQRVYLALQGDGSGVHRGEKLFVTPPGGVTFIAGRVGQAWPYRHYRNSTAGMQPVYVRYGIEQYYVEQGRGRQMERLRGGRNGFQLPMLMHVRVSRSGEAVIAGYEWASIATQTGVVQNPERDAPDEKASARMRLSLRNQGEEPVTLPLKAGNCSFEVVPVLQQAYPPARFAARRSDCDGVEVKPVTLAPGQTWSVEFDLNNPWWWVLHKGKPTPMGRLPWGYRFRIRYAGEPIPGVRGAIVSRAFSGRGNLD